MNAEEHERPLSIDALLLVILVVARVRIDTLANLVAPRPEESIRALPILGRLLSPQAWDLMRNWLTDPISLVLITITFCLVGAYLVVDVLRHRLPSRRAYRLKLGLILAIVLLTVVVQSLYLVLLRHATGPASFTHDGGVIQTEAATDMLLRGENPYTEDYLDTPLAEWGLEKRTALYHYPYLPWTLVASVPVRGISYAVLGWFDERFVYLALFVLTLALLPGLAPRGRDRAGDAALPEDALQGAKAGHEGGMTPPLLLLMVVGLNPMMGNDVIFGMNDSFVLAWVVAGVWLLLRERYRWAALAIGLACASKPTAWFIAPFYLLYLARGAGSVGAGVRLVWRRSWPAFAAAALLILPFVLWDPAAIYDDVWAWAAGTSATPYQIRGWGLSNLVLALGLVSNDQAYFPFWVLQAAVCAPLVYFALRWQARANVLPVAVALRRMLYGFAALFTAYSFLSRFFNENYAGFAIALLALAMLVGSERSG